jgi:hypothetical protein
MGPVYSYNPPPPPPPPGGVPPFPYAESTLPPSVTSPDPVLTTPNASQNIGSTLANLPLDFLFSAPFDAAYEAQYQLAMSTAGFIKKFGVTPSNEMLEFTVSSNFDIPAADLQDASGNQVSFLWTDENGIGAYVNRPGTGNNPEIVIGLTEPVPPQLTPENAANFQELRTTYLAELAAYQTAVRAAFAARVYNKENAVEGSFRNTHDISGVIVNIDDSGRIVGSQGSRAMTLPFLSLLNVPCLSITEVNVDFIIEIKTQNTKQKDTSFNAVRTQRVEETRTTQATAWDSINTKTSMVETSASISQKQAATDSTSTATTYQVHMQAIDQQPIGMKMLLDFVTNNKDSIAPSELGPDKLSLRPVLNKDGFYKYG